MLQPFAHPFPRLVAPGDNHGLGKEIVWQFLVQRQIEADGAPPHVGTPVRNVRIVFQQRVHPFGNLVRGPDRHAVAERHVHQQLGPVGGGKELFRHQRQSQNGGGKEEQGCRDRGSGPAHGRVRINGRIKEIIIRGGENISAIEVDASLAGCPDIRDFATIGMPDERLGERICTFVVPDGTPPTLDDVKAFLESRHVDKHL